MTAIAVGRLPIGNIIVADSMIGVSTNCKTFKEHRVDDKIFDLTASNQHITIVGEEVLFQTFGLLESFLTRNNIVVDLFNDQHFSEFLIAVTKQREIVARNDKPLPIQDSTFVYIVNKETIKEIEVSFNGQKYEILSQGYLLENQLIINYGGNKRIIQPFTCSHTDFFDKIKNQIISEHANRKKIAKSSQVTVLNHDFESGFSGLLIPSDEEYEKQRVYLNLEFTDSFLGWFPDWDYIKSPNYKWSPNFINP